MTIGQLFEKIRDYQNSLDKDIKSEQPLESLREKYKSLPEFRAIADFLAEYEVETKEVLQVDQHLPLLVLQQAVATVTDNTSIQTMSYLLKEIELCDDATPHQQWKLRSQLAANHNMEYKTLKAKVEDFELKQIKSEGVLSSDFTDNNGFIRNAKGRIKQGTHNAKVLLESHKNVWDIRLNDFSQQVYINGTELNDDIITDILCWTEAQTAICPWQRDQVSRAVINIAADNPYNPLQGYLNTLQWDGTKRLRGLPSSAFSLPQNDYYGSVMACFFIQAVARVFEPGVKADYALTMIGAQGCGKSTFAANIAPESHYYLDYMLPGVHDKDSAMALRGKWLIEIAEGHGISKSEVKSIKAFISRQVDEYRAPYARTTEQHPRTSVFIITTNEETPLRDTTANRRYWIVRIPDKTQIDNAYVKEHRDQLWAEAVDLYKKGIEWHYETEESREHQDSATETEVFAEILEEELLRLDEVTLVEIADMLNLTARDLDKSKQTRIGIAMKQIGWTKVVKVLKDSDRKSYRKTKWIRDA